MTLHQRPVLAHRAVEIGEQHSLGGQFRRQVAAHGQAVLLHEQTTQVGVTSAERRQPRREGVRRGGRRRVGGEGRQVEQADVRAPPVLVLAGRHRDRLPGLPGARAKGAQPVGLGLRRG